MIGLVRSRSVWRGGDDKWNDKTELDANINVEEINGVYRIPYKNTDATVEGQIPDKYIINSLKV